MSLMFPPIVAWGRGEPPPHPAPSQTLTTEESAALNQSLAEFQRGSEQNNRAMRDHALNQVITMAKILEHHGVSLNIDPSAPPAEVAIHLKALERPVWRPGQTRIKTFLSACFLVANMVCGYNWQDPAESNISGVEEIERPKSGAKWAPAY